MHEHQIQRQTCCYDKIIIMTDADVDAHVPLLMILLHQMRPSTKATSISPAPPLYRLTKGPTGSMWPMMWRKEAPR
jgi:DNA gyrase/topoisomerase IV subunit B